MAETIDSLLVSLGLETDAKSFQKANDAINGVRTGVLQMAAAAGVGTSFHALTAGLSSSVLEMDRLAKATGFTIRQIEQLKHSFIFNGLTGTGAEGFVQQMKNIRMSIEQGTLSPDAYRSKHFNPKTFADIYDKDQMGAVSYLVSNMEREGNDSTRNTVFNGLGLGLGSENRRFVEYGSDNFKKSKQDFDDIYKPVDQSLIDSANKFNQELANLNTNFTILQRQIGGPLLKSVTSFLEETNKFVKDNPEKAKKAAEIASLWGGAGILKMLRVPGADKITGKALGILSLGTMSGYSAAEYPGGSVGVQGTHANEQKSMEYWLRRKLGDWGFMAPMQEPLQHAQSSSGSSISNPNVKKYLDILAKSEGTAGYMNNGYNTMFGGDQLSDLSDHPRVLKEFTETNGRKNKTSAAGRYQFTQQSWDEAAAALGLKDFSPRSQDMAALYLIQRAGQLENVVNGNFEEATAGLGGVWASLPSSTYAQPKHSYDAMDNFYAMNNTPPTPYSGRASGGGATIQQTNHNTIHANGVDADEVIRRIDERDTSNLNYALSLTKSDNF